MTIHSRAASRGIISIDEEAAAVRTGGASDHVLSLAEVDHFDLGGGDDVLIAEAGVGVVDAGDGDDLLRLDAGADRISLGAGDDTAVAEGPVETLWAGAGADMVILRGGADEVGLGSGADTAHLGGHVRNVTGGLGDDEVSVDTADAVDLGRGDDKLTVGGHVATVVGGHGRDEVQFAQDIAAFDLTVENGVVSLVDWLTGAETVVDGVENFTFRNSVFSIDELDALAGPSAEMPALFVSDGTQLMTVNDADPGVSVLWDRAAQMAVAESGTVGPTGASRAYALTHTAIFDAWASYDDTAVRTSHDWGGDNATLEAGAVASDANKAEAMSFAAHAVLCELFPAQREIFDTLMQERLGHDLDDQGLEALIGRDAAEDLMTFRREDGSNQAGGYADTTGYQPVNPHPGAITAIDRWTPENVPVDDTDDMPEQSFLTPHWGGVTPFALPGGPLGATDFDAIRPPDPEPFFTEAQQGAVLDIGAGTITLAAALTRDGVEHAAGDTIAVGRDLIGSVINPGFIEQAETVIGYSAGLTALHKLIAEWAEDAGGTAFPPGTSMTIGQFGSARDHNSLDDDAKMFFALGNAVMDAGTAAWYFKEETDYVRPVRAIRELGRLGLIGEPEVDPATGETTYTIEAWGGIDPVTGEDLGTQTIPATSFFPFQKWGLHPSPPFAEYVSGHSTFSGAGAEVLTRATGSEEFGGVLHFREGSAQFVAGIPDADIELHFATFRDAADTAGISRLYGGIHFPDGDLNGRALGREIGGLAFEHARKFIDGTADWTDRPGHWTFLADDLV